MEQFRTAKKYILFKKLGGCEKCTAVQNEPGQW